MAHGKDIFYWSELRSALTAGQWSSPTPAKTPKAELLSWSELLRKFNKHATGFTDVADVASHTQNLSLALRADCLDEDQTNGQSDDALALGSECTLPEERVKQVYAGFTKLKEMKSANFDSLQLMLAYYSYALGRPSDCLSYLANVPELADVQSHIPPSSGTTRSAATTLNIPPSDTTSSFRTGSVASGVSSSSIANINDGRAWSMTETIRSICLQGMSHEKLSPKDSPKAIQAYAVALPLITLTLNEIPRALPASGTGKLDFSSFTRFRELWQWIERLLWRTIVLTAQTSPLGEPRLWTLLAQYRTCSIYWPTKFRTAHRSTIAVLHLRALVLKARGGAASTPAWLSETRTVVNDYRAILSVSTRFPKAGERNVKVEDFVDLCVALWEAGGAVGDHAGWVIDILWWATRLTFNSYRVFRHMTRLFYVSGDTQLARRTLRLYVQIVGKAHQAGWAGVGVDADTDRHWVETLTHGARMLCRLAIPSGSVEDAQEAGSLIEKAKPRLDAADSELVASVHLAEGIWSTTMALVEHYPRTRTQRLTHSLAQFATSIEAFPTPSAYYHLAIALARPGPQQDLEQAVASASSAVQDAPGDVRYWHLLGLLLTASGKWTKARGVLDHGAELLSGYEESEGSEDGLQDVSRSSSVGNGGDGVQTRDFAAHQPVNGVTNGHAVDIKEEPIMLLNHGATAIPSPHTLLQSLPDCPGPSRQDSFERALQLRMTQVALTECVEGPEGAALGWVDVFGWVAERKGVISEQPRSSMDTARPSLDTRQPSEYAQPSEVGHTATSQIHLSEKQHSIREDGTINGANNALPPPELTITPATPGFDSDAQFSLGKRSGSIDRESHKGKKVQQMLHKSQAKISTISKKIGNGMVVRRDSMSLSLRRTNSAPDFHTLLQHNPYQASSIHSRRRLSFVRSPEPSRTDSPPPPPPALSPGRQETKLNIRMARENKLLSDLWLMSAATFRRLGKIEQAKGAIQEAEVKDEDNPAVWVQLGLYYMALEHNRHAIDAFHKALFISPDDVSATVHLCRIYLTPASSSKTEDTTMSVEQDCVDLAAGMLSHAAKGAAWDTPEAWYYLAKAYTLQGRKDKEREALTVALNLSERRCIRDIGLAVGWCL